MIRLVLLTLFVILTVPTYVFAEDLCALAVSSHPNVINVKKLERLAVEDQDMILMASLIASQIPPAPIQINPIMIFLAAITEVEVHGQDKGVFHKFSLINRTLFTVLKRLNILEDIQTFLLNQLGFNSNNMGPFSIRAGGGVTLHLETSPTISTISHFNYDERVSLFLNVIGRPRQNETGNQNSQERLSQDTPTFPEYLLLAILDVDIPSRTVLFDTFNTTGIIEIRSALQPLFNEVRQVTKPPMGLLTQFVLDEDAIIQEFIRLTREGKTLADIASMLNTPIFNLWQKVQGYEQTHESIKERRRHPHSGRYSEEKKRTSVQRAIPLYQRGLSMRQVAKILGEHDGNLWRWIDIYGPDYGFVIER